MIKNYIGVPEVEKFSDVINQMRTFFLAKGYTEVHAQDRLSILAACEDPFTVSGYNYNGEYWPLPQTGQMWLEYELLSKPHLRGVFTVSTSYRQEPNPVPGRHKLIFPMFEFEGRGDLGDLRETQTQLLEHLGFGPRNAFRYEKYKDVADYYGVKEIEHEHEGLMQNDFAPVTFLEHFPSYTSPFWNMKKADEEFSHKIDVILYGAETFGSAERSTDVEEMRNEFYTISDGKYAKKLFDLFGKERVEKELEDYFSFKFTPRFGTGIGVSRVIDAMEKAGLLKDKQAARKEKEKIVVA